MPTTKYDYRSLEDQFVRGNTSVRDLARMNGIPVSRVSSIHDQARKPDEKGRTWYTKRAEYRSLSTDKALKLGAEKDARRRLRVAELKDRALDTVAAMCDAFLC